MMNRRMNAGMRREDALHGLYDRTGVQELRSLGANMIQSERWGTSIAQVLRVYSESLRRKRRQAAEKKSSGCRDEDDFSACLVHSSGVVRRHRRTGRHRLGAVIDVFGK